MKTYLGTALVSTGLMQCQGQMLHVTLHEPIKLQTNCQNVFHKALQARMRARLFLRGGGPPPLCVDRRLVTVPRSTQEDGSSSVVIHTETNQVVDKVLDMLVDRYPKKSRSSIQKARQRVERGIGSVDMKSPSMMYNAVEKKLELLDSLTFGLGFTVLFRYPEEFLNDDAFELWSIMSAILFMTGFHPESISSLFKKHPCLFANSVRDPDTVKKLFEWMQENGMDDTVALRVINRFPLILQTSVQDVLEPRLLYLCQSLQMERSMTVQGIIRHPELLSVESSWIQKRVDYYYYLGLREEDIRKLFMAQPSAFAVDIERYLEPMATTLRGYLPENDDRVFVSVLVKSGILSRSISTINARINTWVELGLTKNDIGTSLKRFPRFLLYPIADDKYRAKLDFLTTEMGHSIQSAIPSFPQYLSYSLENRIAPRVLACKAITGKVPRLATLAMNDKAFLQANALHPTTYLAVLEKLPHTKKGKRWIFVDNNNKY